MTDTDRRNQHAGSCYRCHRKVAAGAGMLSYESGEFIDDERTGGRYEKVWSVRCLDAGCADRAKLESARLAVRAAKEALTTLGIGDWTDEAREAARIKREADLRYAEAVLAIREGRLDAPERSEHCHGCGKPTKSLWGLCSQACFLTWLAAQPKPAMTA